MNDDLVLPDTNTEEVTAILAGLAAVQMQGMAFGDGEKVIAAGESTGKLAEENPDLVRDAYLENRDAFRVAQMPDEVLDHLDLEVRDGRLFRPDGDDGWTEVEVE